jgi:hypothetical protein
MWTVLVLMALMSAGPWVLVSQISRQACQGMACRPSPGQAGLQERLVQTFGTVEECLRVRAQLRQQLPAAENAVNDAVAAQRPGVSLRVSPIFLCVPRSDTTEEHLR